jgi:hypothetical protein
MEGEKNNEERRMRSQRTITKREIRLLTVALCLKGIMANEYFKGSM